MIVTESNPANLSPVNTQTWVNGRHLVRCVKVIQETHDVKTFCFMSQNPIMFFFKPGQFVTLELEIDGKQVMRSYTISSSPSVPYSFSITVKRVEGGQVSNWLHDNINVEDELAVHGPVGNFNCIDQSASKVILMSGGVGITPLMSMARWWFDTNGQVDMKFVHSAQSPKDIIYHRELEYMDSRIDNFSLSVICERQNIGDSWMGFRGYLTEDMLKMIAPDLQERYVFCCGPAPYMTAVKKMLNALNFPMENYFEESFGAPPEEAKEEALESAEQAFLETDNTDSFEIVFENAGKRACVSAEETLLSAASQAGLHIPKACGMGICGTCKVKVISGEVTMSHNGGITEDDEKEGYVLSCCSTPKTNVVIET